MNFKDIIYEILINENTDKKKTIERAMGFSPAWAEEFYKLSEKHCIWVANSFLNDYVVTQKKSIEKKANKRFKEEKDLKKAAREILNTSGPRNLVWKEDYEEKISRGASLVQIYTGFIYVGPRIVRKLLS